MSLTLNKSKHTAQNTTPTTSHNHTLTWIADKHTSISTLEVLTSTIQNVITLNVFT